MRRSDSDYNRLHKRKRRNKKENPITAIYERQIGSQSRERNNLRRYLNEIPDVDSDRFFVLGYSKLQIPFYKAFDYINALEKRIFIEKKYDMQHKHASMLGRVLNFFFKSDGYKTGEKHSFLDDSYSDLFQAICILKTSNHNGAKHNIYFIQTIDKSFFRLFLGLVLFYIDLEDLKNCFWPRFDPNKFRSLFTPFWGDFIDEMIEVITNVNNYSLVLDKVDEFIKIACNLRVIDSYKQHIDHSLQQSMEGKDIYISEIYTEEMSNIISREVNKFIDFLFINAKWNYLPKQKGICGSTANVAIYGVPEEVSKLIDIKFASEGLSYLLELDKFLRIEVGADPIDNRDIGFAYKGIYLHPKNRSISGKAPPSAEKKYVFWYSHLSKENYITINDEELWQELESDASDA